MHTRRFVRAVLAPHHAEDSEFRERRFAAEQRLNANVFFARQPVVTQNFGTDSKGSRGGHLGKLYCRICRQRSKGKSARIWQTKCLLIAHRSKLRAVSNKL